MKKQLLIGMCIASVLTGLVVAGQDKYTLQVPGGLAFAEFRGYEDWQTIAVSRSRNTILLMRRLAVASVVVAANGTELALVAVRSRELGRTIVVAVAAVAATWW